MATGKRYYWIKLRESFMTSETMDFLMSQKNGANYVVLYQMLCLKTINTGGRLAATIGEYLIPYDIDKIQRDCKWFSVDTIRVALNLYKGLGLIYEDIDGTLILSEHDSMVGSETDYAEKNRRARARQQAALPEAGHIVSDDVSNAVTDNVSANVPTDIRDKDIRDKSTDTRAKSTDTRDKEDVGAEQPPGRSTPPPTPSEFDILLNDGSTYNVPLDDVALYKKLYQAVDVEAELRAMIGWCFSNPKRRKTNTGIKGFITRWLKKTQDEGGTHRQIRNSEQPKSYADEDDFY